MPVPHSVRQPAKCERCEERRCDRIGVGRCSLTEECSHASLLSVRGRGVVGRTAVVLAIASMMGIAWPASSALAVPAGCDSTYGSVSAPPAEPIIQNTVFGHVVEEDVTELVRVVGLGFDLGPAPPGDPIFGVLPPGTTFVEPPVVDSVLTNTTFGTESSTEFACSANLVITSPSGDSTADWPNLFILEGQLTVTEHEDTIETRHITRTTTYTIASLGAPPAIEAEVRFTG